MPAAWTGAGADTNANAVRALAAAESTYFFNAHLGKGVGSVGGGRQEATPRLGRSVKSRAGTDTRP
ncbi:hypothetical protein GCM10017752_01200 [Streptomyces roseoviridis]